MRGDRSGIPSEPQCWPHTDYPDYEIYAETVERALMAEVAGGVPDDAEAQEANLRQVISLLALIYPSDEIYRAYAGMSRGEKEGNRTLSSFLITSFAPTTSAACCPS